MMGWRANLLVSRISAVEELLSRILRMTDSEIGSLLDHTDPGRTVNYVVSDGLTEDALDDLESEAQ